ncbi:hypothetical protein ACFVYA_41480 [Amycolatopsis sp. NPDC058278]|uniref:hypothetical protein n=1 Tax=Amycolatopsis sp. NPDC058278 TaxID=3346417 RepID=UPI0036D7EB63
MRTPMIEVVSNLYRGMPSMSLTDAADMVVRALVERPEVINRPAGVALELLRLVVQRSSRRGANLAYRMMTETAPEARSRLQPPLATIARTEWRPAVAPQSIAPPSSVSCCPLSHAGPAGLVTATPE